VVTNIINIDSEYNENMGNPTVSVVMAAYNEEEYIAEAIESILYQTYDDLEFIIVDDGSEDATIEIIESYDDSRLRVLQNNSNKGLPASLNRGINASQGTYIARMDADDRSLPHRLEEQVEILNTKPKIHVVGCWVRTIDNNGSRLGISKYRGINCTPQNIKNNGPGIAHPSALIRKDSLERVNGYRNEFTYAQDLDLWVRMARELLSDFIHIIPRVLFERRVSPSTFSRKPIKNEFGNYAGAPPDETNNIDKELSKTSILPEKMQYYQYHYKAGRWALEDENRIKSFLHLTKSLRYNPFAIRPWYGLFLLFLPNMIRNRVTTLISCSDNMM
jgi:glycosyltransferase involved in cell wall biosynthesis